MKCHNCGSEETKEFLSLGRSPLANQLTDTQFQKVRKYPLGLEYCSRCAFVQLTTVVDPARMFRQYPWTTSSSATMVDHFGEMAHDVVEALLLSRGSFIVDIGSNDGTLLKAFKELGEGRTVVQGVEPAENIADLATAAGIPTYPAFFDKHVVDLILTVKDHADLVTATNVLTHVADLDDFVENVKALLKLTGVLVVEVYDLMNVLKNRAYDMVYHEHLHYFTPRTLVDFFRRRGMSVFRIDRVASQGGSLRAYISPDPNRLLEKSVGPFMTYNAEPEITRQYLDFARGVRDNRRDLRSFLWKARKEGKRVVGYTAPAKATTILNYCRVTSNDVEYVVDDSPLKQGKFIPGTGIPIVSPENLERLPPDYVIIFSWNIADEIVKKGLAPGAKFLVPIPDVREVG